MSLRYVQDGRTEDKNNIIFKEKYKITGLFKKAGNNYLFEAGKIIGSQVEIKEKRNGSQIRHLHGQCEIFPLLYYSQPS